MDTSKRSLNIVPLLAVYLSVAVFLLPGSDATISGQDETETTLDHTRIANYDIQVTLNPDKGTISGRETITWTNNGGAPTSELLLCLYLNGLKAAESPEDDSEEISRGSMEIKSVGLVEGVDLSSHVAIQGKSMKVTLPQPVEQGGVIRLEIDYAATLPEITSRTGQLGNYFMLGHWYPKMSAFLDGQWLPVLDSPDSQIYADFGHYRVDITVPKSFEVGATGRRIRARTDARTKTLTYTAHPVHDFAWVASPHFRRAKREFPYQTPEGSSKLEVHLLLQRDNTGLEDKYFEAVEKSLARLTTSFGPFPYEKLLIADTAPGKGYINSGQEFPMLVTAGSTWLERSVLTGNKPVSRVVSRVLGDQFWTAALGSDPGREAWLARGIASYVSNSAIDEFGPFYKNSSFTKIFFDFFSVLHPFRWDFDFNYWDLTALLKNGMATSTLSEARHSFLMSPDYDPVNVSGNRQFSSYSRTISASIKPDLIFRTLEPIIGKDTLYRVLSRYYNSYKFQKVTGPQLRKLFSEVTGKDLEWYFQQVLDSNKTLDYAVVSIKENEIHCQRLGEVILPQTIRIYLDNKSQFDIKWPIARQGEQTWMGEFAKAKGLDGVSWRMQEGLNSKWLKIEVESEASVVAAAIDPQLGYALDINFANNSYSTVENRAFANRTELAWVRVLSRWFHGISSYN